MTNHFYDMLAAHPDESYNNIMLRLGYHHVGTRLWYNPELHLYGRAVYIGFGRHESITYGTGFSPDILKHMQLGVLRREMHALLAAIHRDQPENREVMLHNLFQLLPLQFLEDAVKEVGDIRPILLGQVWVVSTFPTIKTEPVS